MDKKAENFLSEWLIFAFFAAAFACLLGYLTHHEREDVAERERQHLCDVASVAEYMLANQLETIDTTLSNIRNFMRLPGQEGPDENPEALRNAGSRLKILTGAMTSVRTLSIVDARGTIVTSNLDEIVGTNASQHDYFMTPRHNPDPQTLFISPPLQERSRRMDHQCLACHHRR